MPVFCVCVAGCMLVPLFVLQFEDKEDRGGKDYYKISIQKGIRGQGEGSKLTCV